MFLKLNMYLFWLFMMIINIKNFLPTYNNFRPTEGRKKRRFNLIWSCFLHSSLNLEIVLFISGKFLRHLSMVLAFQLFQDKNKTNQFSEFGSNVLQTHSLFCTFGEKIIQEQIICITYTVCLCTCVQTCHACSNPFCGSTISLYNVQFLQRTGGLRSLFKTLLKYTHQLTNYYLTRDQCCGRYYRRFGPIFGDFRQFSAFKFWKQNLSSRWMLIVFI
jgi:hypothetical protein